MRKVLRRYFEIPLIARILAAVLAGAVTGFLLWQISKYTTRIDTIRFITVISPFGNVFVYMLKMIVIPVIFFSLVTGAASLPIKKFGTVGAKVIGWYFITSLLSAALGTLLAFLVNPASGSTAADWKTLAPSAAVKAEELGMARQEGDGFAALLYSMFQNPFQALAEGNFLAIIVFAILIGLAVRVCIEAADHERQADRLQDILDLMQAGRDVVFKLVDWVLEYSPIGVFILTVVNFALYGPRIFGPYVSITLGVIGGVAGLIFVVYPILMWLTTGHHPFRVLKRIQEVMLMAFVTRSSAATLPVSMKVAGEELKIRDELSSFALPLGATINMNGVCVHLPIFVVLASNMFGIPMNAFDIFVLVMMTVLAAIGAGGVPGGSLMLLFIILKPMGLEADQISVIVALALGINPILDMFETMANVTGDLVCTYIVAQRENMMESELPTESFSSVNK